MAQQEKLVPRNPFNLMVCATCGKHMGKHFLFRPEFFADVRQDGFGRKPNGRLYCHRDQTGWAGSWFQRQLRRIESHDYDKTVGFNTGRRPAPHAGQEMSYGRW